MTMTEQGVSRPWYREKMVWMLIAVPMSAVIMGVFMITTSVVTWDGLVVDDYYKRGKEINRVLDRDRFASRHGMSAVVDWDPESGKVLLAMDSRQPVERQVPVRLSFVHPTRSGLDRQVDLAPGPDGNHHGLVPAQMVQGEWILQLETEQWRLVGRTRLEQGPLSVEFGALPED